MKGKTSLSYDYIIFQELLYEYDSSQQKKVEVKIKRRLKYNKLAPYNQERVDYIRNFKTELSNEIRLMRESKYYKKTPSQFAEVDDFNIELMVKYYASRYQQLGVDDLRDMVGRGVHWLYTR